MTFSFIKKRKFQLQVLSFIVSSIALAALINIQLAIIIMIGTLIHELGHLYTAKKFGYRIDGIYFIPILGGITRYWVDKYQPSIQKFYTSLMGPVFGMMLSIVFLLLYLITADKFFAQATAINSYINLFNLIPYIKSDGFSMLQCITSATKSFKKRITIFSIALSIGVIYMFAIGWQFAAVILFGFGFTTILKFKDYDNLANPPTKKEYKEMIIMYIIPLIILIVSAFYVSAKENIDSIFVPWWAING